MKIVVKANGGLGNRMRVIASCIALNQRLRNGVDVIWVNNEELNCSFGELFQPVEGLKIVSQKYVPKWNKLGLKLRKRAFVSKYKDYDIQFSDEEVRELRDMKSDLVKLIKDAQTVYIDTCEAFFGDESFLAFLLPQPDIQNELRTRLSSIGKEYIGVHIRRGDNAKSKEVSTSKHFEELIAQLILIDSETKFYLSTDDKLEADELLSLHPNNLYHFPGGLSRNSPADIKLALVDLLMLSKSKKVFGSYWSSFSEVAAAYGGAELEFAGYKKK